MTDARWSNVEIHADPTDAEQAISDLIGSADSIAPDSTFDVRVRRVNGKTRSVVIPTGQGRSMEIDILAGWPFSPERTSRILKDEEMSAADARNALDAAYELVDAHQPILHGDEFRRCKIVAYEAALDAAASITTTQPPGLEKWLDADGRFTLMRERDENGVPRTMMLDPDMGCDDIDADQFIDEGHLRIINAADVVRLTLTVIGMTPGWRISFGAFDDEPMVGSDDEGSVETLRRITALKARAPQ